MLKTMIAAMFAASIATPARALEMPQFDIKAECADSFEGCERSKQELLDLSAQRWDELGEGSQKFCIKHSHSTLALANCIVVRFGLEHNHAKSH